MQASPAMPSPVGAGKLGCMPEISRFFGTVVGMFYNEHGSPHFHAVHGEHRISVDVRSKTVRGDFPPRALRHLLEWAELHEDELLRNWERAREGKPLNPIPPLE